MMLVVEEVTKKYFIFKSRIFLEEQCYHMILGFTFVFRAIRSFFVSERAKEQKSDSIVKKSESLPSLLCHERTERIAHGYSFVKISQHYCSCIFGNTRLTGQLHRPQFQPVVHWWPTDSGSAINNKTFFFVHLCMDFQL